VQSRADECTQLIEQHGADRAELRRVLDDDFKTLHSRAQLVLGICGVLLTSSVLITTGRIIGKGSFMLARVAGWSLAAAGLCDIISTAIIVAGVLHIKWLTSKPDEELRAWLTRAIAHRNRKTRAYHAALGIVLLSMFFYQAAVLIVVLQL
jgi:hypothetical protein